MSRNARGVSWTRRSRALALLLPAFAALALVVNSTVDSQPQSAQDAAARSDAAADSTADLAADSSLGGLAGGDAVHDHSTHDHGDTSSPLSASAIYSSPERLRAARALGASVGCGRGDVGVQVGTVGVACTHATLDQPLHPATTAAVPDGMELTCHGDGVSGSRVQLFYVHAAGAPDRTEEVAGTIAGVYAPRIEAMLRRESKEAGKELSVRFYMPGCRVSVTTVAIKRLDTGEGDVGDQLANVAQGLIDAGYAWSNRKNLIWVDGGAKGACGVANRSPDVTPTPLNTHNGVVLSRHVIQLSRVIVPTFALMFHKNLANDPSRPTCWGDGSTGANSAIHELWHTLGAVGDDAPNADPAGGHCTDGPDILCNILFAEITVRNVCLGTFDFLDCNKDDYFNPRPAPGSYLSTHWNTANSSFLGPAPTDVIPLPFPQLP